MINILTKTQYVYGDSSQGQFQDGIYSVKLDGNQILSYNYDELGRLDSRDLNCGNATITSTYTYCSGSGSADAATNFDDIRSFSKLSLGNCANDLGWVMQRYGMLTPYNISVSYTMLW